MATNIPPHNLSEVIDACQLLLANPEAGIDDLIAIVPAPDFPTRGIVYGVAGVREGYRTGRGRVVMRARTHFEEDKKGGRVSIIVDELPYQVGGDQLLKRIGELVHEKRVEGISDLRNESDKKGTRLVIELKRGENEEVILNNLWKETQMEETFGMNVVALVNGQPRLLNLKQLLDAFLQHRREVVTRRTVYELRKARERGHVLEGLAVALSSVDDVIALIKAAQTPAEAKAALMARFWRSKLVEELLARSAGLQSRPEGISAQFGLQKNGYRLSDVQAQQILDMRLQRLTALEQDKIVAEYRETMDKIADLMDVLAKPARVTEIISLELAEVKKQYGDERKTEIVTQTQELSTKDLIAAEDVVVTLSHGGYMKSQPVTDYRAQKRGGRGKQATTTKDDDFVEKLFIANTHDSILCFSNRGRVYWLKVYDVPQGSRTSRGRPIVNLVPLMEHEKITAVLPVSQFDDEHFVFMATQLGTVKKTALSAFSRPMSKGIIAVTLEDTDYLIGVALTDGRKDVMLFSDEGKAIRFPEEEVRPMGRAATGVRGMRLPSGQRVISLLVAGDEQCDVLTATENGYGKRTPIEEYSRHGRGGQGIIAIDTSERNGKVVAAQLVTEGDEIMLITTGGVLIRTRVKEIRQMSRATQGVTLINLDEGERLSGVEKIVEADDPDGEAGNGASGSSGATGATGTNGTSGMGGTGGTAGEAGGQGDDPGGAV